MKKIMFYCQNLLGMGHLVRTTEIMRNLVQDFHVCLIDGGQIIQGFDIPAEVEVVHLPAIRAEQKEIKVVDDTHSLEEVKEFRKQKLLTVFEQFQPACLVTEGYPFSKHNALSFEMVPLLNYIQSARPSVKVVCSLRDIFMVKEYADRRREEEKRCQFVNQYYDMVLLHSDPKVHRLEDCFSKAKELTCQVHYTGYVVQSPPTNPLLDEEDIISLNQPELMILVSVGGGRLGYDLLECVVKTAPILANSLPHKIQVFTGPFISNENFLQLQTLAHNQANLSIRKYTPNLLAYMEKASLSISLGGYNTTMNVLKTGVRSLIYPSSKDKEQSMRAEKLEQMGIVGVIHPDDLQPYCFAQKIIAFLQQERPLEKLKYLELQGAQKTTYFIQNLLQSQVINVA